MYKGTDANVIVYLFENNAPIRQHHSVKTKKEYKNIKWTIKVTLEDIKNTLCLRKDLMYNLLVVDSWQFIIINRQPGLLFSLFDII